MKLKLYFLILMGSGLVMLAFTGLRSSDGDFLELLKKRLALFNERLPQEKIYIHVDKTFVKPGEDIWFKVYAVNGVDHKAAEVSDVAYVELINPKGGVEKMLALFLKDGGAKGDFAMEESLPGGLYKIRAYTQWMKNFGEETFFEKEIQVQKVITPRVLLKIDFEKEAYGPSDDVVADLEVKSIKNAPLVHQKIKYYVQLEGKEYMKSTAQTDKEGKVKLKFTLPAQLHSIDGLLNATIDYEGKTEAISRSVPIVLNKIDLQFFPEGGELVQNVAGKVAFKAVNEFGKPADVEGEVLDEKGKVVEHFKSFHQGMGAFDLKAEPGKVYQVKLTNPRGIKEVYKLPEIVEKGYTLGIEGMEKEELRVSYHVPLRKEVYLVAQVRGKVYFSEMLKPSVGKNNVLVSLEDFPVGIAQLTLFDHNQIARCERMVFVNAEKKMTVKVSTDKKQYQPREKVELTISTLDDDGLPIPAHLSLSVVDDKILSFADDKQDNILSSLLMSSDLKGKIEEPSFYFKKDEPKAAQALDYLLMTQGWRRFTWKEVMEGDRKITNQAEKPGVFSGKVVDAGNNTPVVADVTLVELNNKRRVAQLRTRDDGSFVFRNVDASIPVQLFAKSVGSKKQSVTIMVDQLGNTTASLGQKNKKNTEDNDDLSFGIIKEEVAEVLVAEVEQGDAENIYLGGTLENVAMREDVKALYEIVVSGYATQKKNSLIGAISTISANSLGAPTPRISVDQALQGRMAGVEVVNTEGVPGDATQIRIRGISGSRAMNEPLFVVDGVPIYNGSLDNLSATGYLSPANIESISIMKSAEASSLYGNRASAGVVLITTRKGLFTPRRIYYKNPYSNLFIVPRSFTETREFYSPKYETKETERTDFRSTIYWNPDVQTNEKGIAKLSFYNSDETTSFRAIAEGIAVNGLVGREEHTYYTQLPFSMDAKIPPYLTFGDVVHLPVFLKNNTSEVIKGRIKYMFPSSLKMMGSSDSLLSIESNQSKTVYLSCLVLAKPGKENLKIEFKGDSYKDAFVQEIEVQPKGFPVEASFSGKELEKAFTFNINDPVKGSVMAEFKAYPDILGDLMAGIESILREPYGCFEQTSASTYPNILALQYLKETGHVNEEVEKRALQYIRSGYKRLEGFETKEDGFEWYGGTPPHEGLTAFGLMEFLEMQKVYDGVSDALIKRTKAWLLSRRKGDGNFKQNQGRYGFSAASREVNNAYVVYALSEAGIMDIPVEFDFAFKEALKSKDAYRMALLANAASNFKNQENYNFLINELIIMMKRKGIEGLEAKESIVSAYGKCLQMETASLIGLALMKSSAPDVESLQVIVNYLVGSRAYGGFGSTQSTILALKVLTEYAKFTRKTSEAGTLSLYHNNQLLNSKHYEKGEQGEIAFAGLGKYIDAGAQKFRVAYTDTKEAFPYSMNVSWTTLTPNPSKACKVDIETSLSKSETKVGETVRLSTTIKNKHSEGLPMTVALVGIPSGLSPQPWQLKELQEKHVFDFYEVRKNYVVFYYRELGPDAVHEINLDLKAEVPGHYLAPASSAYLYYTNEFKDWEEGEEVEVGR